MALIGKIRKNSWLLIALIGLGLAAFILMDMFGGEKSPFGASRNSMGKIAGETVDMNEWNKLMNIRNRFLPNPDANGQRASLWNYMVERSIIQKTSEKLGLGVSTEELNELQFGQNMSPLMAQRFPSNSAPGGFQFNQMPDMERINQFKTAIENDEMNEEFKAYWKMQEGEIRKQRLQDKLNSLVSKAMYTPDWMVAQANNDQNQRASFAYVKIPFDEVDNMDVGEISDADMQAYLSANAAKYATDEEVRKVSYVAFDVVPTAKDSLGIKNEVGALSDAFASAPSDTAFIQNNYGTFGNGWMNEDMLPEGLKTLGFTTAVGSVAGPYLDGNKYTIAKIIDRRVLPDSAKVRHILLSVDPQNQAIPLETQFRAAEAKADSLKTVLEAGGDFDALAAQFSTDPGSKDKGGVYDYTAVNQWVPEFNDVAFYKGDLKKLYSIRTQFGVHLIEPLGRKNINSVERVKVAYVSKNIIPSSETRDAIYEKAFQFINNNKNLADFEKAVAENPALSIETSPLFKANDFSVGSLGSNDGSRNLVKGTFDADLNDVLPKVYPFQSTDDPAYVYENKYVAAVLTNIQGAGSPSLANFREDILPFVRNEKKGEIIKSKINSQDLSSIAASFNTQVDTANSVSFSSPNVPSLGNEPKVVATAFSMDQNAVSAPVVGENGVYVVQLTFKPEPADASNISPSLKKSFSAAPRAQVPGALIQGMKKTADIVDNRSTFY